MRNDGEEVPSWPVRLPTLQIEAVRWAESGR